MYKKSHGKYKFFVIVVCFALCYSFIVPAVEAVTLNQQHGLRYATYYMHGEMVDVPPDYGYVVNPYMRYSYEQLTEDLQQLQQMYPALFQLYSIGKSVEGRELYAFRFGRGDRIITMNAGIHAREYITTAFLMYMVDRYAYGYVNDETWDGYNIREALDNVTFSIVPMINPDGVNLVQNGPEATQNPQAIKAMLAQEKGLQQSDWKANVNGVDLNRNFSSRWKKSKVKKPAHAEFGGFSAASEPETQAMEQYYNLTPFYMNINVHAQGEVIFWLDSKTKKLRSQYESAITRIAQALKYTSLPATKNEAYGYLSDYLNDHFGKVNMTLEICPFIGEVYPEENFDRVVQNAKKLGLVAAQEVMAMPEMKYEVYQEENLLQNFDTFSYANDFSTWYQDGYVMTK